MESVIVDMGQAEIVRTLETGEIDFVAGPFRPTEERQSRFLFTHILWEENIMLAMRKVDEKSNAFFDLFNVFKSDLWLAILIAFLVNIMLGIAFRTLEKKFISRDPIAPLEVSCLLSSNKLKRAFFSS